LHSNFIHDIAWLNLHTNSLTGTIPSQIALLSNLGESSVVWLLVVMIVLSCVFSLYSHACLSFFIRQITCISTTIISRVNSRVLALLLIVTFPVMLKQTHILKLAVPFREILMHSRGVILYKVVYIIGLKCTMFALFDFEFELCHTVE
jgi:hypothetical protein